MIFGCANFVNADVFKHSATQHNIEGVICEGQNSGIGRQQMHAVSLFTLRTTVLCGNRRYQSRTPENQRQPDTLRSHRCRSRNPTRAWCPEICLWQPHVAETGASRSVRCGGGHRSLHHEAPEDELPLATPPTCWGQWCCLACAG